MAQGSTTFGEYMRGVRSPESASCYTMTSAASFVCVCVRVQSVSGVCGLIVLAMPAAPVA